MTDISSGRQLLAEQERDLLRKSVDQLFQRVADVEMSRMHYNHGDTTSNTMEVYERIASQIDSVVSEKIAQVEQRLNMAVDNQGKDIAVDFTELERRIYEFREQVEVAVTEITNAIVKLNHTGNEGEQPVITTNTSNLFT